MPRDSLLAMKRSLLVLACLGIASFGIGSNVEPAAACGDRGQYLAKFKVGDSANKIIWGINSGCPATIEVHNGMGGYAICEYTGKYTRTLMIDSQTRRVKKIKLMPRRFCSADF